jgi:hypothetical protein
MTSGKQGKGIGMGWVLLGILLALKTCPARAQEIYGFVGVAQDTATHTGT